MLKLTSQIIINNTIEFDFVNEVEIFSSWQNLTDTCRITIPKQLTFQGKPIVNGINSIFQRGQTVVVNLGYDGNLVNVFTGYISKIHPQFPLVFDCEDSMYQLKKTTIAPKEFKSVSLSVLMKYVLPPWVKYKIVAEYTNLGKWRLNNNPTVAQVLNKLREEFNCYSFFRDGTLYIGLPYVTALQKNVTFYMEKNVIDHDLEYMRPDDLSVKVRGVSIADDNSRLEYWYPSEDTIGETKTLHLSNVDMPTLQQAITNHYNSFKYEGWKGKFTTFGAPFVNHGDVIQFQSNVIPEFGVGGYLAKSVHRSFGMGGYRQIIEPANRALV